MTQYYPLRRIPNVASRKELWFRLLPLVWPVLKSVLSSVTAQLSPRSLVMWELLDERARRLGDDAIEKAQEIYFQTPGLDTLTVRALSRFGRFAVRGAQNAMIARIAFGLDRDGRARRQLRQLPRTGFDSLMVGALVAGTAMGYFRGGSVSSLIWWDSADPEQKKRRTLPEGHPYPEVRRFEAPGDLGDLAADIDDLYWAHAYGQPVKVTRVGEGSSRRWLVAVPGTDHMGITSQTNPADIESNLRGELNMRSAAELGTIAAVKSAMHADGLSPEDMVHEQVLMVGHSQGGMITVALASAPPEKVGFTVSGVITLGSPTRRLRVRDDVRMIAIEHDQDMVPSLDATPRKEPDQRVILRRSLNMPKRGALFYAHSSATYTETLRAAERKQAIAPWGRAGKVFAELEEFLPKPDEETRITHHYAWQDLIEPKKRSAMETFTDIRPSDPWEPVTYGDEIEVPEPMVADPVNLVASASAMLGLKKEEEEGADE